MDQMWKFEAEDGWHLCLRLEKENHCLCLEAEHDGCLWKLYAQDMLDNTEDHPSSFCLETQHKGRFWLFHEGTKVEQHPDGITLHTCPVNCETKAPVPALMVHYRIQVKGARISARTSFAAESRGSAIPFTGCSGSCTGPAVTGSTVLDRTACCPMRRIPCALARLPSPGDRFGRPWAAVAKPVDARSARANP